MGIAASLIHDVAARRVKALSILVSITGILLATVLGTRLVPFREFDTADVGRILTEFTLLALFMERALEVLLIPWREQEMNTLELQFQQARESGAETGSLEQKISQYKGRTREVAFLTGLATGTVLSALGIRAIAPFFDEAAFQQLPAAQVSLLRAMDVLISGALLAGGADGIHKVVVVFTTYFERTKENLEKK